MTPTRLHPTQLELLAASRTGTLATIADDGTPRLVPVCFVATTQADGGLLLHSPLDEKPKRTADPLELARVRDIARRPVASLLVHRWDEDWSRLAWLRLVGTARIVEPRDDASRGSVLAALRGKYPQYLAHDLEARPLVEIRVERVRGWAAR